MYRKLNLDRDKIDRCRVIASRIVSPVQKYIDRHSTTAIERTVLRTFGIKGARDGVPLVNLIVDRMDRDRLRKGIGWWFGKALVHTGSNPQELAEDIAHQRFSLEDAPHVPRDKVEQAVRKLADEGLKRIDEQRRTRERILEATNPQPQPLKLITVATGSADDDRDQALSAVDCGADIVSVAGQTVPSLAEHLSMGLAAAFRSMRDILDQGGKKVRRYVRLAYSSSGPCMPEITAAAALERVDILFNDSMCDALFHDINLKRTFIDQHFSRLICTRAGITIKTGEDNYLKTADAYRNAHQVLVSQFINEQFAQRANVPPELMGMGHAFEINPAVEDGFLYELAQAQMIREIFPRAPITYMPPTKYVSGNIALSNAMDALFNVAGIFTEQSIQMLGIPTEAIHRPHVQDRYVALENARYIFNNMRHIGDEIAVIPGGKIARRAHTVLENTFKYLKRIEGMGLMKAMSRGLLADVERSENAGTGLDGVFQIDRDYLNPVLDALKKAT